MLPAFPRQCGAGGVNGSVDLLCCNPASVPASVLIPQSSPEMARPCIRLLGVQGSECNPFGYLEAHVC